ncbi:MAG: SIR2 family protein [Gammaproteobacteria bacterium]|nr:SIR2 family protein [Gammaproteobacteria bacterium]
MPRIKVGQKRVSKTWQQIIFEQIKSGKAMPVISNMVADECMLGGHKQLIEEYAGYLNYPLPDRCNLPQMTQFVSVTDKESKGSLEIKKDYLNFVKNRLCDIAEADNLSPNLLEEAEDGFDDMSFSQLAATLGYPKFTEPHQEPLLILADLPLPIYLTTSCCDFMEVALKRAGKQPRTEVCRWHGGMREIDSVFDGDYQPSEPEPLVYHLHGMDNEPASLVLTEDNYLEFLVNISRDLDRIPYRIRQALADSSLILLGYNLKNWDFRSLFWGLLQSREYRQQGVSILQLVPSEEEKNYLQEYMGNSEFKVFWGELHEYTQQLYEKLME